MSRRRSRSRRSSASRTATRSTAAATRTRSSASAPSADIAYVPFGTITDADDSAAVDAIAAAHNATPQQVRLAWTLHHSPNILAIPGTGNVAHLEENIAAASLHLSPEELTTLD